MPREQDTEPATAPTPACLVCGARSFEPLWNVLLRCPECGFVTARADAPVDTTAIYDGNYFTGDEYLDYLADEPFFRRNFRRRLADVRRRTPSGRLLEIGAAYGFFLDLARAHFDVVGFELNQQAARHARETLGLDVRTDDFVKVEPASLGGPFDVIVMWDVIEHLERPDAFLARFAELSRPGTTLHITTGDIGSRLARLRGRKWRMIHPPSHLHYFDRRTLPRLLASHGFETADIRSVGVARSLRQIAYSVLVLGLNQPPLYTATANILPRTWGVTVNTGDIMQVTAVRSSRPD